MHADASFLEVAGQHLLRLCYRPATGVVRRRVVLLPPLFEELNKCRRLCALVGRELAARDCEFVHVDLSGTGDSSGEAGEATWVTWHAELLAAIGTGNAGDAPPLVLLSLRAGSLLAPAVLAGLTQPVARYVAAQPVLDGKQYLQQLLRLRVMASKFAGNEESVASLRALSADGAMLEVAGYDLNPAIVAALGEARLDVGTVASAAKTTLLEFRQGEAPAPSVVVTRLADAAAAGGQQVSSVAVTAESFWTTQEIVAPAAAVQSIVAACVDE